MLTAERAGFWGTRYELAEDGIPVTVWDTGFWAGGGRFDLGGHGYHVRANMWGSRYSLLDGSGAVIAEAEQVGRKNWTVSAAGRAYTFRRPSVFSSDQHLVDGERTIGVIRRTSAWTGALSADLPGLPLPIQVFVIGVIIAQWQAANAA